jgi:hypothetical protein
MYKTIICSFYENNICKFMNESHRCKYAHGEDELVIPECRFGVRCYNVNCDFKHYDIIDKKIEININDIIKVNKNIKKVKNKKNNKIQDFKNIPQNNIFYDEGIKNEDKNNNSYINIIDRLKKKCQFLTLNYINAFTRTVFKLENEISKLKDENKILTKQINIKNTSVDVSTNTDGISEIKKKHFEIQTYVIPNRDGRKSDVKNINHINIMEKNRLLKLYNKWSNVYKIFEKYSFSYKIIKNNIDEIKKYVKDKNIHKIKERCTKIYLYYNKILNNEVTEYKHISKIIKMNL